MFVTTLPLLVTYALQPAHDAIDRAWGPLVRSHHERGSWVARIGDKRISGDWKITSVEQSYNPLAHQATTQTWVHYVDSRGVGYCTVALENPQTMYCNAKQAPTSIEAHVEPIEPLLAQELELFQLIHRQDLGRHLGIALPETKTPTLTIRLPFRIESSRAHWSNATTTGYDRELDGYEAEIVIGPRASDLAFVTATSTGRVTEHCAYPAHAATSCSFPMPICEIR